MRAFRFRHGDVVARLDPAEAGIVGLLLDQLEQLLAADADDVAGDPVMARLLPDGHRSDPDLAAGEVLFPIPALVLGAHGLLKRPGFNPDEPADRASYIVVVVLRCLLLLLVLALSAVILVSTIGASVRHVQLHGLVYVFFALDVLLALVIVFSFGRRDRRRVRRRGTPAAK